MKRKKTLIALALLVTISLLGVTQSSRLINLLDKKEEKDYDGKEEFKKLCNRYMDAEVDFDISELFFLYDVEKNNALKEQAPFRTSKKGNNLFTQIGYQKTYLVGNIMVQLDTLDKFIIVSQANAEALPVNDKSSFPFEEFMDDTSGFKIKATVTDNGTERILRLQNELIPEIKTALIYYDPADYSIRKTEIEWWKETGIIEKPDEKKCWLSRMNYSYHDAGLLRIENEIKRIVIIKDTVVVATEKYKDYELAVHLGNDPGE